VAVKIEIVDMNNIILLQLNKKCDVCYIDKTFYNDIKANPYVVEAIARAVKGGTRILSPLEPSLTMGRSLG
jgi:hypothetical protein